MTRTANELTVIEHQGGHLRVLGPPGSGKTSLLISRFAALEERARGSTLVITYSRQSQERLLDAITASAPAGIGRPPVTTHTALARQVFARPLEVLSGVEEQLLLDAVAKQNRDLLKSGYGAICATRRFQDAALECCHLLMQNGVTADEASVMRETVHGERLADILRLYSLFLDALGGRATYYDLAWRARAELDMERGRNPLASATTVLIEDFQDIDPGQYALLAAMAPPRGGPSLNVFGDPAGARFGFRGTSDRFLMKQFPEEYGGDTVRLPAASGAGRALDPLVRPLLEKTVVDDAEEYTAAGSESARPGGPETVELLAVGDEFEETALVASRIRSLLDGGGYAPEEIAVVARNKRAYEPVVAMMFQHYGVPLETGRSRHTPFRTLVSCFIALIRGDGDEAAVRALETSPFRNAIDKTLGPRFETETNGEREHSFRGIVHWFASSLAAARGAWFERLVTDLLIPLLASPDSPGEASPYNLELVELVEEWKRYMRFVTQGGFSRDDAAFAQRSAVLADTIAETRPVAGRVGFYSCNQLNNRFFRAVFLVGCSETIFPALPQEDLFFPYRELQRALDTVRPGGETEVYRARPVDRQMKDEYALLFHSLMRATDMLTLTAPRRFGDQVVPAPAFVFKDTIQCADAGASPHDLLPPLARFSRAALGSGDGLLAEIASEIPLAPCWGVEAPAQPSFMLEHYPLSSNSLASFTGCERKFFYQQVMRVPELDRLGFTLGSMLHELLESICRDHATPAALRAALEGSVVEEEIARLIEERSGTIPEGLFRTLFAGQLRSLADKFFSLEESREALYSIDVTEQEFEFSSGGYSFRGRIDRIDRDPGGRPVVIDYKTGGQEQRKADTLRARIVETGVDDVKRNWQVPLYLSAVIDRERRLPSRYLHYLLPLDKEPKALALHLFDRDEAADAGDLPGGRGGAAPLLREELELCMEDAVAVAARIFETRTTFQKTGDLQRCMQCRFKQLCRRDGSGSE